MKWKLTIIPLQKVDIKITKIAFIGFRSLRPLKFGAHIVEM